MAPRRRTAAPGTRSAVRSCPGPTTAGAGTRGARPRRCGGARRATASVPARPRPLRAGRRRPSRRPCPGRRPLCGSRSAPRASRSVRTPMVNAAVTRTISGQSPKLSRPHSATSTTVPASTAYPCTCAAGRPGSRPGPGPRRSTTSPPHARGALAGRCRAVNTPPGSPSTSVAHSHSPSGGGPDPASAATSTSSAGSARPGPSRPGRPAPSGRGGHRQLLSRSASFSGVVTAAACRRGSRDREPAPMAPGMAGGNRCRWTLTCSPPVKSAPEPRAARPSRSRVT